MNIILIKSIWVYWAALATWFGWILIFLLSEYYLWKKYRINYDYNSILKNIFFIWFLWLFFYKFWLNFFIWISRLNSLFILWLFFIIWFLIFILINHKEFKFFILEVKKLKR
jgi:hypothetical protein